MDYKLFITHAKMEDSRNNFSESSSIVELPNQLKDFYRMANPIDVEVTYPKMGPVVFSPVEGLDDLKGDYDLPETAIPFATCNGDPVFLEDGKVYTTLHGMYKPELVAKSFEDFIYMYINK